LSKAVDTPLQLKASGTSFSRSSVAFTSFPLIFVFLAFSPFLIRSHLYPSSELSSGFLPFDGRYFFQKTPPFSCASEFSFFFSISCRASLSPPRFLDVLGVIVFSYAAVMARAFLSFRLVAPLSPDFSPFRTPL